MIDSALAFLATAPLTDGQEAALGAYLSRLIQTTGNSAAFDAFVAAEAVEADEADEAEEA